MDGLQKTPEVLSVMYQRQNHLHKIRTYQYYYSMEEHSRLVKATHYPHPS
jgi:hypothetical protein